ncbi:hypothetical protein CGCSCA1_v013861 [Colletotrichum siamense]|nr:hypothetical protein CGCSCA1_v013861 [Colletotrichum siamense]
MSLASPPHHLHVYNVSPCPPYQAFFSPHPLTPNQVNHPVRFLHSHSFIIYRAVLVFSLRSFQARQNHSLKELLRAVLTLILITFNQPHSTRVPNPPNIKMRFSTVFVSAFAAFAAAAPTTNEPRANVDLSQLNNLQGFRNLDLNYLLALNGLNLQGLGQLGQVNNLNVLAFQNLFGAQNFDLNALLQLQQLSTILAIQQQGVFGNVNLANLNFGGLNLGLINGIGQVNLGQFIDQALIPQITQIVQQSAGKSSPPFVRLASLRC